MNLMSKLIIFFVTVTAMYSINAQNMNFNKIEIDKLLNSEVGSDRTPSVQYAVFNGDSIIHTFRQGYADVVKGYEVNDNTTYNLFSLTKTFTAIAVLQLNEQKRLDINEPAAKYLPGLVYGEKITVRQLLSHSAGIPNPVPLSWIHPAGEHNSFNRNAFFAGIIKKNPVVNSDPDEKFAYSNLGYVLIGQIIEKVSGASYEEYVTKNILQKLGLLPKDLAFTVTDPLNQAVGYQKKWSLMNLLLGFFIDKSKFMGEGTSVWKPYKPYYVNGASYGGLIGTPFALVKYAQALLNEQTGLLNSESRKLLFTENLTREGEPTGMCLAWFRGMLNGQEYFSHAGGGGGYYCELRIYPKLGMGSVIMFNRTGVSDERFLDKVDKYIIKK
jgi:D-alanyl-D-alanine carboxypeptidase